MATRVIPAERMPLHDVKCSRTLCQSNPYLRSSSVCFTTATRADEAEKRRQRRDERAVIVACLLALLALAALMWGGA